MTEDSPSSQAPIVLSPGDAVTRLEYGIDERTASLIRTVRWVGSSVIGVGSALTGLVGLAEIDGLARSSWQPVLLLGLAVLALLAAGAVTAWALSTPEPPWSEITTEPLALEARGQNAEAPLLRVGWRRVKAGGPSRLRRAAEGAGAVALLQYEQVAKLVPEVRRWQQALLEATSQLRSTPEQTSSSPPPDQAPRRWQQALLEATSRLRSTPEQTSSSPPPDQALRRERAEAVLADLYRNIGQVTAAIRNELTQRRVPRALVGISTAGALILTFLMGVLLLTDEPGTPQPVPVPTPTSPVADASVTEMTRVTVFFTGDPEALGASYEDCTPAKIDTAFVVGGTWTRPQLQFLTEPTPITSAAGSKEPQRTGLCKSAAPGWLWMPKEPGQVLLRPWDGAK
jgi:hypothetical protein